MSALKSLFAAATLRQLALALVSIFGPLYTLKVIRSASNFSFTQSLAWVLASYVLLRLSTVIVARDAAIFQKKVGFRYATLLGNLLLGIGMVLLILAEQQPLLLLPSVVFRGAAIPFYWLSYHLLMATESHLDHLGTEISWITNLGRLSQALGPAIGGIIIVSQGFNVLYSVAVSLLVVSSLPLFLMPHHKHDHVPSHRKLLQKLLSSQNRPNLLAFGGAAIQGEIQGIIWPIFLFLIYDSYEKLGFLVSIVFVVSVLAYFLMGKGVDKFGAQRLLWAGSKVRAAMWTIKSVVQTGPQAFVVDLADRTLGSLFILPFDTLFYQKARAHFSLEFMLLREWNINLARAAILLLVILLIWIGLSWKLSFWLAAGASLLTVNLARKGN